MVPYWASFIKKGSRNYARSRSYAGGFVVQYLENGLSKNLPLVLGDKTIKPTFKKSNQDAPGPRGFAAVAESFRDSQESFIDSFEIHFAAMLSLPWSRTVPPCKPVKRPSVALKSMGLAFVSPSVCFARTEILLIKCW